MAIASSGLLRHGQYTGSVEVSIEDRCLHGRLLHIPDLVTYEGPTVEELEASFVLAVEDYLRHCAEVGKEPARPYSGSFNVRLGAGRHRLLIERSASTKQSLNELICDAVDAYLAPVPQAKVKTVRVVSSLSAAVSSAQDYVVMKAQAVTGESIDIHIPQSPGQHVYRYSS